MGVWEYGSMGVWEYGSMGVWEYGSMGVKRPKRIVNKLLITIQRPEA
jgi:hypothetical protein